MPARSPRPTRGSDLTAGVHRRVTPRRPVQVRPKSKHPAGLIVRRGRRRASSGMYRRAGCRAARASRRSDGRRVERAPRPWADTDDHDRRAGRRSRPQCRSPAASHALRAASTRLRLHGEKRLVGLLARLSRSRLGPPRSRAIRWLFGVAAGRAMISSAPSRFGGPAPRTGDDASPTAGGTVSPPVTPALTAACCRSTSRRSASSERMVP